MQTRLNPRALDRIRYEQEIRSDTELATVLGMSRATVKRWRDGDSSPSMEQIALMVIRFGIPFEDLILVDHEAEVAA
ncbi:helix-turn-helix domain-containing protein [Kocuria indica]|uniref:Helix-turn-helix domain-containing protein n=1 Tax=Kocuria marina subsp. indica TaxID=1049583 RepID=A0A6N9R0Q6_9MICC|nr:helix-turn-helix transcriptional regulator [Kocuria indica]NDO78231.1 helix-turn-helix domain-containing protein [Kocuria indica]